MADSILHDF